MGRFVFGKREKAIIRELAKGKKIAAVARNNGLHRCTIHRWLQREDVQEYLESQQKIEDMKTLMLLEEQLDDPNPWIALRASNKILDMIFPKPKKPEVKIVFVRDLDC